MADFDLAYQLLRKVEAGYVVDRDGETYAGINREFHPAFPGWARIDAAKGQPGFPGTLALDQALQAEIEQFYQATYWSPLYSEIPYQVVANMLLLAAVNAGPGPAVGALQRAINAVLPNGVPPLEVDGKFGTDTLHGLTYSEPRALAEQFRRWLLIHYALVVKSHPAKVDDLVGWIHRVYAS